MPKEVRENTAKSWNAYWDRTIGRGRFKKDRAIINKIKYIIEKQDNIKTILDAGSGNGEICLMLRKELGKTSFGVDWSNKIVGWLNRKVNGKVEFFKCKDVNEMPEKTLNKFDCLVANESIEYIGSSIFKKVKEETLCIVVLNQRVETFEKLKEELKALGFREANQEDVKEEVREVEPELFKRIYIKEGKK